MRSKSWAASAMVDAIVVMLCGALLCGSTATVWASCDSRPGIPANLVAQNPAPGEISLNWQSVGNVHCFDIEVSRNGKVVGQSITGGNCGKTNILFKELGYNQNYCFRVRARTEAGTEGCISAQASNTVCSGTSNPPFVAPGQQVTPTFTDSDMVGREFTNPSYSQQILERSSAAACQSICQKDSKCQAWTWARLRYPTLMSSSCDLKSTVGPTKRNGFAISGVKDNLIVK